MDVDRIKHWIRLSLGTSIGPSLYVMLCDSFGSPEALFGAEKNEFIRKGFSALVYDIINNIPDYKMDEVLRLLDSGVAFITYQDTSYPERLKQISTYPPFLFVRGSVSALTGEKLISVVGSRDANYYGLNHTRLLSADLSRRGFSVVSGFALGVDIEAHRACFENGNPTIAVMAHGLDQIAPLSHKKYVSALLEAGGAFVSEFLPGIAPYATNFPRRNRIISALSRGLLVTQARKKSGALITARFAIEQNRDVFAVPGALDDPMSAGTHSLIKMGAQLVESADDIMDAWNYKQQLSFEMIQRSSDAFIDLIQKGINTVDLLVDSTSESPNEIMLKLTQYELDGKVALLPGGIYKIL